MDTGRKDRDMPKRTSVMREGFMPLPVAFISTRSREGINNIVPYSCIIPLLRPLDLTCLASAEKRDTLANIRETREFVVNLAGKNFMDKSDSFGAMFPDGKDPPCRSL